MSDAPMPLVKYLGQVDYIPTWRAMEQFTLERDRKSTRLNSSHH